MPPSLATEERMLRRGAPTKVVYVECLRMCCLGVKNSVVKGLTL